MGFLSNIGKKVGVGLDYLVSPITEPVTFITQGPRSAVEELRKEKYEIGTGQRSALKESAKIIGTTAILAGGVLAVAPSTALAGSSLTAVALRTTSTAVKSVLSVPALKQTVGIIGASAILAPQTFKAVVSKPAVAKTVIASSINPVLGVATAIEQGTSLIKESGIVGKENLKTAGLLTAGTLLGGAGIVAVDKSIDYFKNLKESEKGGALSTEPLPKDVKTPATEELKPTITPTNNVPSGNRMSQKVIVNVSNKQTKKYINGVSINM